MKLPCIFHHWHLVKRYDVNKSKVKDLDCIQEYGSYQCCKCGKTEEQALVYGIM